MDLFLKSNTGSNKQNFSLDNDHTDYYEILNVSKNSTKSQIREAYIRLKNAFSSQSQALYSLVTEEESDQMLKTIEEAFRVLNDDFTKKEYDTKIGLCVAEANRSEADTYGHEAFRAKQKQTVQAFPPTATANLAFGSSTRSEHVFEPALATETLEAKTKFNTSAGARNIWAESVDQESIQTRMQEAIVNYQMYDGELYKRLREIAGVSEDEMQERTKVSLQYIRAIEQNTFEKLPSPVFVKGFLRSYLRYLKVQQTDDMVKAFATRYENWQQGIQEKS